MVTSLATTLQPPALAAGVLILTLTGVAWIASLLVVKCVPRVNARVPAGEVMLMD